jgi:hypothetical protein
MQIYLDSNVYLSIANREHGYEYTLAKIKSLFDSGCIFPHAPPHAEELSARFISNRDVPATFRSYNLIKKFNDGMGYIPGYCNATETRETIRLFVGHPELADALKIHLSNLELILSGTITEEQFSTMLVREDLGACMTRVDKYLDLTDVAKRNEIFHFGRRDSKSLSSNFEAISQTTEGVDTFLEIQKRYNLGPRRLSRIPPEEIFEDKFFFEFLQLRFSDAGMSLQHIPTGSILMKSHHQKEVIIGKILNCMEESGYNQEEKNHLASLTGRMHDVSHAIYASSSNYFVTNDKRFSKKVIAAYMKLGIPTKTLSIDEFIRFDFSVNQSIISLPS